MKWRHPRYIITDRRFAREFPGLDLCREVRNRYIPPYVYIDVLSVKTSIHLLSPPQARGRTVCHHQHRR
ncbi:MAG TPA: hypothetical protein VMV72_09625 [Verrucomicrobiae bacterium]|nr:hypothetical protein [Verrucomicrobiae bacterium]